MFLISAGFILISYEYNLKNKLNSSVIEQWLKSEDKICGFLSSFSTKVFFS